LALRTSCGRPSGQRLGQVLRLLDARRADEHGLPVRVPLGDVVDDRVELGDLVLVR
jgi:hypothetical protein